LIPKVTVMVWRLQSAARVGPYPRRAQQMRIVGHGGFRHACQRHDNRLAIWLRRLSWLTKATEGWDAGDAELLDLLFNARQGLATVAPTLSVPDQTRPVSNAQQKAGSGVAQRGSPAGKSRFGARLLLGRRTWRTTRSKQRAEVFAWPVQLKASAQPERPEHTYAENQADFRLQSSAAKTGRSIRSQQRGPAQRRGLSTLFQQPR